MINAFLIKRQKAFIKASNAGFAKFLSYLA